MKQILKQILLVLTFFTGIIMCEAQYNKEKISKLLTGEIEKSWSVSGINAERPEKILSFNVNKSVKMEMNNGSIKNEKWSLKSTDNIRWFLSMGKEEYELIISYDKKGNEYIKLTHQSVNAKSSGYYEIKLNQIK